MFEPVDGSSNTRLFGMIGISIVSVLVLVLFGSSPKPLVLSTWNGVGQIANPVAIVHDALAGSQPQMMITGAAEAAQAQPIAAGSLDEYNAGSKQIEQAAGGDIALYQRNLEQGGSLFYIVAILGDHTHLEVINADGATPGSDATGDTIWMDGGQHLQQVAAMAQAPYAARDGMELLGALAYGFHGARTSNEGTVVANGTVLRVNPGRSALCIRPDNRAEIGLYTQETAATCAQAFGAGPVLMIDGRIANTGVQTENDQYLPFNPLGEDFVQLDWRKQVYDGTYPKTTFGIGTLADGRDFVVLAASYDARGMDVVAQLRAMGCSSAMGADDDTSTQMVWRGQPLVQRQVRSVPDAIGVYAR